MKLYTRIFELTKGPEISKDFKFKYQILASAGSVMDNIAEGHERDSRLEYINHLSIAKGSAGETMSQILRGVINGYWNQQTANQLVIDYRKLTARIANLIQYLNNAELKGLKFKDRTK